MGTLTVRTGGLSCILMPCLAAPAQHDAPLLERQVAVDVYSGWVENDTGGRAVIFSALVTEPGAPWLRLTFSRAELGDTAAEATVLRLTALRDGAVQHHTTTTLRQWRNTSAYFNGDAVSLEIVASPGSGQSLVSLREITVGEPAGGVATICGPLDDRLPSDDPRTGRLVPAGCTAWLIDDAARCLLTAGHCGPAPNSVMEFNVPESESDGDLVHPGPEDQYPVDNESVQSNFGGLGDDWAYFGCSASSETGLTPGEAQGAFYMLAAAPPPVLGQTIRITGYGTDGSPQEWNQIQQTHTGPYVSASGTVIQYQVDTEGGNSGSAVLDETTGLAIGIHTNGGCDPQKRDANLGTALNNGGLQTAMADPFGVCVPELPVEFVFPDGLPELVDPDGGTVVAVEVIGTRSGEPLPGSGELHVDTGGGFQALPMTELKPNVYEAVFPAAECGLTVSYFFSALSSEGEPVNEPNGAPDDAFTALAAEALDFSFSDDFETDQGWTVIDAPGLTAGTWERGIPAGFGDRGDPPFDADGSGRCYATDPADGDTDVDDGTTTLTSPRLDATDGDAHVTYYRWYSNTQGNEPMADVFRVEVSPDDGFSWFELETVGPAGPEVDGGWFFRSFRVADVIPATGQFRIRFVASDLAGGSIVEAAVDGVRMNRSADGFICGACPGDIAQPPDGEVDVLDLVEVILSWGRSGVPADLNRDGIVDVDDLVAVIIAWGRC